MKIQLASDLHLELLVKQFPRTRVIEPSPEAGLLVLAGDVHGATKAIDVFGHWPVPVLYVAGNHEFYSERWEATRVAIREAAAGTSVRFLDNDALELGGVRFLGCTLWTDFNLPGASQNEWMQEVGRGLNDYLVIRTQRGRVRPHQTLEDHERSRAWLEAELAKPFDGMAVVVSHHAPHRKSIHPHACDPLNAGFVSDLTPLLHGADLWLHGHVHDSVDYEVAGCRVVSNPAGYVLTSFGKSADMRLEFENQLFNPRLVIEVGP